MDKTVLNDLVKKIQNVCRDFELEHDGVVRLAVSTGVDSDGLNYVRIEEDESALDESDKVAVSKAIEARRKKDEMRMAPNSTMPKAVDPKTSTI